MIEGNFENVNFLSNITPKLEPYTDEVGITDSSHHNENAKILFVEPFYGGSHKQLIDTLIHFLGTDKCRLVTLTAKKWHWRARCSALILTEKIPIVTNEKVLFCSSVINLPELLGIRPDLQKLKKIVYFHENQLVYPIRAIKQRDVQFAYNQIVTCLSADVVVFNSGYNKESMLNNVNNIIKLLPDYRPKNLVSKIETKCKVVYFPLDLSKIIITSPQTRSTNLNIVWAHRWEFDKGPEEFFKVLLQLHEHNLDFRVSILGQTFVDVPLPLTEIKDKLKHKVLHFGYLENKNDYYEVLRSSHVAVSTAKHEFFGVSMLEATYCGCLPLLPNNLVYPEIYPKNCLYDNLDNLFERLKEYCLNPTLATEQRINTQIDFSKYSVDTLLPHYLELFDEGLK